MQMNNLELISRLSDVISNLSEIVKCQQTIIEQSKIEEMVKEELRMKIKSTESEIRIIEHGTTRIHV